MNSAIIGNICSLLSTMKADQKWIPAHVEAYTLGLGDLPDSVAPMLRREILLRWDWRPSVKEIRDLTVEIMQPRGAMTAADAIAALNRAATEPQYRESVIDRDVFVPYPGQTDNAKAIVEAKVKGAPPPDVPPVTGQWEKRQEPCLIRISGVPPCVRENPILCKIVDVMGWDVFATGPGEGTPASVFRGQVLKVAQAVIDGAADDGLNRMRLEYQEQRRIEQQQFLLGEAA